MEIVVDYEATTGRDVLGGIKEGAQAAAIQNLTTKVRHFRAQLEVIQQKLGCRLTRGEHEPAVKHLRPWGALRLVGFRGRPAMQGGSKTHAALSHILQEAPVDVAKAEFLERQQDGTILLVSQTGAAWTGTRAPAYPQAVSYTHLRAQENPEKRV